MTGVLLMLVDNKARGVRSSLVSLLDRSSQLVKLVEVSSLDGLIKIVDSERFGRVTSVVRQLYFMEVLSEVGLIKFVEVSSKVGLIKFVEFLSEVGFKKLVEVSKVGLSKLIDWQPQGRVAQSPQGDHKEIRLLNDRNRVEIFIQMSNNPNSSLTKPAIHVVCLLLEFEIQ